MSYYGPASQDAAQRKVARRLSQYDYNQHRDPDESVQLHRAGHFNRHNKRLRRTFRTVPWRDEQELQAVGKAMLSVLEFPNDPINQAMSPEEAFATISIWKSRQEGLPHAIESTASLSQVYWRDSQRRARRFRGVSVMELRLAYSAAIVRCINGFADILQQQRAMAASVSSLCGQLGIPSWVVDTRHEGSHNALPNLEVLRLSASTLLEYMKSEFWIPRCAGWNNCDNERNSVVDTANRIAISGEDEAKSLDTKDRSPIDYLLEYKVCSLAWNKARGLSIDDVETNGDKKSTGKRQKKSSSGPQKTRILPYDPLFGEVGSLVDSSDEEDNSDAADDHRKGPQVNLDKPVVNSSIWGSSVGTNTNRFILLDISPTKKKKKGKDKKKSKKPIQKSIKKKKGEKSPTDCAKRFVQSVPSLQEGYKVAIQYLLSGGVGELPWGEGVLISDTKNPFPATQQGVIKCWQLYSPLVHVICRSWPGFAANMITYLVDRIISLEEEMLCDENETENSIGRHQRKAITRKLYFLSAWIRLLLSQRFVAALDQSFAVTTISSKNSNPLELPLAQLNHLEYLGYPLESLLDRCRRFHSARSIAAKPGLTEISQSVVHYLEAVFGQTNIGNFGYPETDEPQPDTKQKVSGKINEKGDNVLAETDTGISSEAMSLDEMEKMLLSEDDDNQNEVRDEPELRTHNDSDFVEQASTVQSETNGTSAESEAPIRRPAWIRCERWDACAIGSLPGYPS